MAAIDQLIIESQEQHQRYSELYGPKPASGAGFRDLSTSAKQLVEQINDIRDDVQALQFSTEVVPHYAQATAADHRPVSTTAHVTQVAAQTTDHSAQVIRDGLAAILANSNSELNQISAVPDYDSPEGQAAILGIIADHQAQSAQTVTNSAVVQQAAGAQAAASAGGLGAGPAAGVAATAALGAMVPALASALTVAPQAAAALVPAAAALASAPVSALSAVRQPPGSHPGTSPTQPQPTPATQTGPAPTAGASPPAPDASPAPVGPSAPTAPPTPPHGGDGSQSGQHVQLAGFGTGQHPPQTPAPPDPPHGQDPRYWLDTKQILTLPPGQLPPAGYTQIGPGMYYPSTDPGYFALPPPPPAQLPVDMRDILHLPPGELPPPGYQQMAPGTYFPVPHGTDVPGPWPTPKQPIDVRDIIHLKPGELLPSPGYIEFAPGWYAPNVNSPNISAGGPR